MSATSTAITRRLRSEGRTTAWGSWRRRRGTGCAAWRAMSSARCSERRAVGMAARGGRCDQSRQSPAEAGRGSLSWRTEVQLLGCGAQGDLSLVKLSRRSRMRDDDRMKVSSQKAAHGRTTLIHPSTPEGSSVRTHKRQKTRSPVMMRASVHVSHCPRHRITAPKGREDKTSRCRAVCRRWIRCHKDNKSTCK